MSFFVHDQIDQRISQIYQNHPVLSPNTRDQAASAAMSSASTSPSSSAMASSSGSSPISQAAATTATASVGNGLGENFSAGMDGQGAGQVQGQEQMQSESDVYSLHSPASGLSAAIEIATGSASVSAAFPATGDASADIFHS